MFQHVTRISTLVIVVLFVYIIPVFFVHATINDPTDITGANLMLWLDGTDAATLFTDSGCSVGVSSDGDAVGCWEDKSGNGFDVTQSSVVSLPQYRTNLINGMSGLEFVASEGDTLESLAPNWTSSSTIFIVFQATNIGGLGNNDAFFSNATTSAGTSSLQIDYDGSSSFRLKVDSATYSTDFAPATSNFNLYTGTIDYDGSTTTVTTYSNGSLANQSGFGGDKGRTYDAYRINNNRGGGNHTDAHIIEAIVYDGVLDACSISEVNLYLGNRYGVDFSGIASNFDEFAGTHGGGENVGVGFFDTTGCSPELINEVAVSSIMTIAIGSSDNKHTLDLSDEEETLTFDHDGGSIAEVSGTYATGTYTDRIARTWRFDQDDPSDADTDSPVDVQKLDISIDLNGVIDTSLRNVSDFALLIDVDQDGDFSDAVVHTTGRSVDTVNHVISFTDVDLSDGDWATLATQASTILDTTDPAVIITAPTKSVSNTNITDTTIQATDDMAIASSSVLISASTTVGTSGFACVQTSATTVDCSITITSSGDLYIDATDVAGNSSFVSEAGYSVTTSGGGGGGSKDECNDNKDNDNDGLEDEDDPGCHTDGDPTNDDSYDKNDDDESDLSIEVFAEEPLFGYAATNTGGIPGIAALIPAGASALEQQLITTVVIAIAQIVDRIVELGGTVSESVEAFATIGRALSLTDGLVLSATCPTYTTSVVQGDDGDAVTAIQAFLADRGYFKVAPTGYFGPQTEVAVRAFQSEYADSILMPWGHNNPTGKWLTTTQRQANVLVGCPVDAITLSNGVALSAIY